MPRKETKRATIDAGLRAAAKRVADKHKVPLRPVSPGNALPDADYTLVEGAAWLTVGKFAVRVLKTDEGVVVDIYANGREMDDALASCYAFDSEVE